MVDLHDVRPFLFSEVIPLAGLPTRQLPGVEPPTRRMAALDSMQAALLRETDRLVLRVIAVQWALALVFGLMTSKPLLGLAAGTGLAMLGVATITTLRSFAGARHGLAVAQLAWCALIGTLAPTLVETGPLLALGALAMLALYRDARLVATATIAIVAHQLVLAAVVPTDLGALANQLAVVVVIAGVLVVACRRGAADQRNDARRVAQLARVTAIVERKVREHTLELQEEIEQFREIVESTEAVAFEYDIVKNQLMYVAPQAARLLDCEPADLRMGFLLRRVHLDDRANALREYEQFCQGHRGPSHSFDCRLLATHDRVVFVRMHVSKRPGSRRVRGFCLDITRHKELECDLQQSQKLESVGRLAAGVAHEINTPIQFVGDSVEFVRGAVDDLLDLVAQQRAIVRGVLDGTVSREQAIAAEETVELIDLPYLTSNLPTAIVRAVEGVERVARIVRSLKVFSHPDQPEMVEVDINQAIDSTLTIARNEYRYVADLVTDLRELPRVWCHAGDLGQVVLNIVINAAHAIAAAKPTERGTITVATRLDGDHVEITIADTGCGIPEHARHHIFDPFFTTKAIGKGTGQGLSIARSVIVDRYGGTLTFDTVVGAGTTFRIRLPARPHALEAAA
ncbi:MAG: hypothetical protein H0T89_34850 [Deltaproteobacteria bacterium]|nr:hypothetical protein [Deltaproteobacteria bacterium]MDQ3298999.1 ATP-binding protein [Myxococcota bacterium]